MDNRVRVPLNGKTVDLAVLDAELGGHGLAASDVEVVAVAGSPVTAVQLAAAVLAHTVPEPSVEPTIPEVLERIEALEQQLADVQAASPFGGEP